MPQDTRFKLFNESLRFIELVSSYRKDYVNTNDLTQQDTAAAEAKSGIRWTVEQFHREDKQITGLECCSCCLSRSQRNYVALAALTWLHFEQVACQTSKTIYQLKQQLLDDYLRQELASHSLAFA